MMQRWLWVLMCLPTGALAQGWGNVVKKEEETGFSWTAPLWPSFWMAWTPATFLLFVASLAPSDSSHSSRSRVIATGLNGAESLV